MLDISDSDSTANNEKFMTIDEWRAQGVEKYSEHVKYWHVLYHSKEKWTNWMYDLNVTNRDIRFFEIQEKL